MRIPLSSVFTKSLLSFVLILFPIASLAQNNTARQRVTQAVDMQNLVTLRGNVHPLARPEFDQGVAPDDLPMQRMLLVLQRGADQEVALRKMLDEQQVKSSSQFHEWLTPEQFGQQYGPAESDVQAVTSWLASQGFVVTRVAAGRTVIEFSGTASLVRQVFGTEIHRFRVNGADHWANTSDPQIPSALAPVVAGFASLNNFPRRTMYRNLGSFRRSKATGKVEPLVTLPCSGGSAGCIDIAVGPGDFATIYNITPLWNSGTTGAGQTIAVVGETDINPQDVADFRSIFGLPMNPPNIILNGPDPGITSIGEEGEADLDVEWSGAVAEDAKIDFVISETTESSQGIDLSALYIIDNNLAPVMSESYGGCEAELGTGGNQFYSTLWEQAAAEGITVLLSSGDSGSAGCDSSQLGDVAALNGLAVNGFASTPFNVAVGGTDLNFDASNYTTYWNTSNPPITNSAKSYIPESTWNSSCAASGSLTGCSPPPSAAILDEGGYLAAGSGGLSSVYPKPTWQNGTKVPSDGARDLPDVSLLADLYVTCQTDATALAGGSATSCDLNSPYLDFQVVGGTSASVQVFAGIMALVNQAHGRQGNANYVLYPMASTAYTANNGTYCTSNAAAVSISACIFYDTQTGNNSVVCYGGSPNCNNTSTAANQYGVMVTKSGSLAYPTSAGYDLATGLGSVNVANMVKNWKSNFTSTSTTLSLATNPVTSPITLTHGQPINFNIGVTGSTGTPTGDVSLIAQTSTFSNGNGGSGMGPFTLSSGSASGTTTMLPGGSYNVIAHYAGNGTFGGSDSSPVPVKVTTESSKTAVEVVSCDYTTGNCTPGITNTVFGSSFLLLRMDVTNGSGQDCFSSTTGLISYPCPTGTVTTTLNGKAPTDVGNPPGGPPGTYILNSQGSAEDQFIQLSPATYSIVSKYAGDSGYTASTSPTVAVTVSQAQTATTFTGLPASGSGITQANITAIVSTNSYGTAPTGTIQLLDNGSPLGNAVSVSGSGATSSSYASALAVINVVLPTGKLSISAKYSGDVNYAGSSSAATTVSVTDYTLSANPSPVSISAPGQSGNSTISVTPEGGFTGTVNLSVTSGCPTAATCTLASPSVTVSGATAGMDVLTVTTTGSSGAPPAISRRSPPSFRLPLGLLSLLASLVTLSLVLLRWPATRRRPAWVAGAVMLLVAGTWAACGGGGGGTTPTPTPTPAATLSSPSLTFASQTVGTTSAAQNVMLTDSGTGSLSITGISVSGMNSGDFAETNTCGSGVAAGANCSISVAFTPAASGSRSASLNFTDNASGSPQAVSLTGTGAKVTTPAGTYAIVVNAVSGGNSHSITVNVTVQ